MAHEQAGAVLPHIAPSNDRAGLEKARRETFGGSLSGRVSAAYMTRVLEHHAKTSARGGLRAEVARALDQVAAGEVVAKPNTGLKSGAQLVRDGMGGVSRSRSRKPALFLMNGGLRALQRSLGTSPERISPVRASSG